MGYFTKFARAILLQLQFWHRPSAAVFIHKENNERNEIVPVRVRLGNFVSGENKRISLKLAAENTAVASFCLSLRGLEPAFHMIATIAVTADKNGSAIASIDGFHMIAAIAEWRPRETGSNNIVRAIPQIQHSGCELSTPTWGVFSSNYGRRERQRTHVRDLNRISLRLLSSSWFSCTCLYIPLYFFHKKCHVDCFLNVCLGSLFEKRERTQCILGTFNLRSLRRAVIAGEWLPYDHYDRHDRTEVYLSDRCRYNRCDRCHRWRLVSILSLRSLNFCFIDRSDHSDHEETRLKCTEKALKICFENKQIHIQTQLLNCYNELRSYR